MSPTRQERARNLRRLLRMTFLVLSLIGAAHVATVGAQSPASGGSRKRIGTPTRHVVVFTELERQVLTAATQGNRATLETLVADDFQLWTAEDPAEPVDRKRWIEQLLS